ncbi:MAG TPA: S8/S53 family peptidase [Streptosporangiaceae bacterium]
MLGPKSWEDHLVERIADQVQTIKAGFQAAPGNLTIVDVPAPDGGLEYMYAEGQLLVRDRYVEQVSQIFSPKVPFDGGLVKRVVPGVSLLTQDTKIPAANRLSVPDALKTIDTSLGSGIATPNHVFTVAPVGPCPATEPDEVSYGVEPFPSVCLENSGAGVLIYVADTGLLQDADINPDHPWLNGVTRALKPDGTLQDWDPAGITLNGVTTIPPYAGHGTFVAGLIRCMAPEADVIVSNIFKVAGSQLESDLGAELDGALDLGVDVFNLSITATTRKELAPLGFDGFVQRLHQHQGVVCVVAAGNNGNHKPCWPAAMPGMVSVGALGADWRGRATFSNYGHWVKVYAPGRNLVNAYATGPYTCQDFPYKDDVRNFWGMSRWSGTSFSTPIVAGLVAARMSRTGETGKDAAEALLAEARTHAIPGVGPVLLPCGGHCDEPPRRPCCHDTDCGCGRDR